MFQSFQRRRLNSRSRRTCASQQRGRARRFRLEALEPRIILTADNPFPLANTFLLHSAPGAHHTIYLDFDGNITTGTIWNSSYTGGAPIVTPAFDTDGNPSSFSDQELTDIQRIWQRVEEDYIPFNVNVTTQDPGAAALSKTSPSDTDWGIRVCIGGSWADWWGISVGGVGYVGSFNDSVDTPVFVFADAPSEKHITETISHEAGHSLGLSHDGLTNPPMTYYNGSGSGPTGWSPIMGASPRELSQWSKGEYSGATNTEDDLAIITTGHGFSYRADEYGNTVATASPLNVSGTTSTGAGIIERNTDADMFSFSTSGGSYGIVINPFERGPNLDILARLYDANNTLIASSNPVDALGASFQVDLPAGQYFLSVTGTGKGDPLTGGYSNYGSLGQYFISAGPNSPPVANAGAAIVGSEDVPVTFDASASFDADGNALTYVWDFGDGTTGSSNSPTISHAYSWGGTFTATLTVDDGHGGTVTATTGAVVSEVNDVPIANAGGPYTGIKGTAVSLSAAASSDNDNLDGTTANNQSLTYSWNFGDGTTGTGVSPSHTYATAGNYTVTLTVSDGIAASTAVTSVSIAAPSVNDMYVWDITSEIKKKGNKQDARLSVVVRRDSNANGLSGSSDAVVSGATVTVELRTSSGTLIGTSTGTTNTQGTFTSGWFANVANGTYLAEVTSLTRNTYTWNKLLDPTPNDTDLDSDNLPDQQFTVSGGAAAKGAIATTTNGEGSTANNEAFASSAEPHKTTSTALPLKPSIVDHVISTLTKSRSRPNSATATDVECDLLDALLSLS